MSLSGYKTYILAGLAAVATGLYYAQVIDEGLYQATMTFLGISGAATLRHAIGKAEK